MNNTETPEITLKGDIAAWLKKEAARAMRNPTQHAEYLLAGIRRRAEARKAASAARKAKRERLGLR